MEVVAVSAAAVSLLPTLEPMAGAVLAINLAYLNLEKTRYRSAIRNNARKEIARLKITAKENSKDGGNGENGENGADSDLPSYLTKREAYKIVDRLAADAEDPAHLPDPQPRTNTDAVLPGGLWSFIFRAFFEKEQDRKISYVFTAFSLLAFALGTAHSFDHLQSLMFLSSGSWGVLCYYILVVGILFPIFLLYCGGRMVQWAKIESIKQVRELEGIMKDFVAGASLTPLPQNSE